MEIEIEDKEVLNKLRLIDWFSVSPDEAASFGMSMRFFRASSDAELRLRSNMYEHAYIVVAFGVILAVTWLFSLGLGFTILSFLLLVMLKMGWDVIRHRLSIYAKKAQRGLVMDELSALQEKHPNHKHSEVEEPEAG